MKTKSSLGLLLKSNKREIRFITLFILFFLIGQIVTYVGRSYVKPTLIHKLNAGVASKIINVILPNEKTWIQGNIIRSGLFSLTIEKGCEGTEGIVLVTSAILAYEMHFIQKVLGLIIGSLIVYVANLIRIIALFSTLKYKPEIFDLMHVYIGQTFIIFIGSIFFIIWINNFGTRYEYRTKREEN